MSESEETRSTYAARNQSEMWTEIPDLQPWKADANCRGTAAQLWFPERGDLTAAAKEVCRGCSVRAECLEYGMHEKFGIWGGTSERERRQLRKVAS